MKVLLLGANGMLGQAIKKVFLKGKNIKLVCVAKENSDYNMDLTDDALLKLCFKKVKPDVIINSAAIVNIDYCERNFLDAYRINARLCSKLSELTKTEGGYLIQISTDHYYMGQKNKKHRENDEIFLVNEYARTKFLGECLARTDCHSLVVRTNIVGFRGILYKPTFLEWAISAMKNKEKMMLFDDFYTSSIHAIQLAEVLLKLLILKPSGILNIASSDVVSKKEFILGLSNKLFGEEPQYEIGSVNGSVNVKRATSLGLDVVCAEQYLGYSLPTFDDVLESIKQEYYEEVIKNEV